MKTGDLACILRCHALQIARAYFYTLKVKQYQLVMCLEKLLLNGNCKYWRKGL